MVRLALGVMLFGTPVAAQIDPGELRFLERVVGEFGFLPYAELRLDELAQTAKEHSGQVRLDRARFELRIRATAPEAPRTVVIVESRRTLELARSILRRDASPLLWESREQSLLGLALGRACLHFAMALETVPARLRRKTEGEPLSETVTGLAKTGVAVLGKVERSSLSRLDAFDVSLTRALLMFERARAARSNRQLALRAREALEEIVLEIGERGVVGLVAFSKLAEIEGMLGRWEAAIASYTDSIQVVELYLFGQRRLHGDGVRRRLIDLLQNDLARRAAACLAADDVDGARETVQRFYRRLKELGVVANPRHEKSIMETDRALRARSDR